MKISFIIIILSFALKANAQNVGVNTTTPSERLDVNGNINLTGTIKTNGTDGQPNQVLMKNGQGDLAWGDLSGYKDRATFTVSGTWQVPPGVTKIAIEAWGAGGGGSNNGGGGGGGYIRASFTVVPDDVITFTIGVGGAGASTNSTGGLSTTVLAGSVTIVASGAVGGSPRGSGGGYTAAPAAFTNYFGAFGENGHGKQTEYHQTGTSSFIEISLGGYGGDGAQTENTGGLGAYRILNVGGATVRSYQGSIGKQPGGGGGAGFELLSAALSLPGYNGANGLVSILY